MNLKDYQVDKLKCRFCGMTGYVKNVCRKFAKSEAETTSSTLKS